MKPLSFKIAHDFALLPYTELATQNLVQYAKSSEPSQHGIFNPATLSKKSLKSVKTGEILPNNNGS